MWQKHYSLHCQIERYPTTVKTHVVLHDSVCWNWFGKKKWVLKINMVYLSENYIYFSLLKQLFLDLKQTLSRSIIRNLFYQKEYSKKIKTHKLHLYILCPSLELKTHYNTKLWWQGTALQNMGSSWAVAAQALVRTIRHLSCLFGNICRATVLLKGCQPTSPSGEDKSFPV